MIFLDKNRNKLLVCFTAHLEKTKLTMKKLEKKQPQPAPTAHNPKRVTLQIRSIVVSKKSENPEDDDANAIYFLRKCSFTDVKGPDPGKDQTIATADKQPIMIEYTPNPSNTYMPFTIYHEVKLKGAKEYIETGRIYLPPEKLSGSSEEIRFFAHGDTIAEWEIIAGPKLEKVKVETVENNSLVLPPIVRANKTATVALPKIVETIPPSIIQQSVVAPLISRQKSMRKWPSNPMLLTYMDKHHSGDHRVIAMSEALHTLMNQHGHSLKMLAEKFVDTTGNMALVLAVVNLDPELRDCLEKESRTSGQMSSKALRIMVCVPMSKQKEIWDKAQKKCIGEKYTYPALVYALEELAAEHIERAKGKCIYALWPEETKTET